MKINRVLALALMVVVIVVVMGALTTGLLGQGSRFAAEAQQAGSARTAQDQVQNQNGHQREEAGDDDAAEAAGAEQEDDDQGAEPADDDQDKEQADDGADSAPSGSPAITAEAAQKAAEAYLKAGAATKVELDDENGKLVYGVEFAGGTEVKVDAMTGAILQTEADDD